MHEHSNVIFAARAHGIGKDAVMISLHKNYADYSNLVMKQKADWSDEVEDLDSMLIGLEGRIPKPFSLKYLAELEEEQ